MRAGGSTMNLPSRAACSVVAQAAMTRMVKAPVMRLTARRTASARGMVGLAPFLVAGRVRTASAVLASGGVVNDATLADDETVVEGSAAGADGAPGLAPFAAAWFSSSSIRWAMISVSVSETNLWPLAMRAFLRVR